MNGAANSFSALREAVPLVPACVPHAESGIGKIPFHARGDAGGYNRGDAGGYEGAFGGMAWRRIHRGLHGNMI